MIRAAKWWWYWFGPHGPINPTISAFLAAAQFILLLIWLMPPALWLLRPIADAYMNWAAYWLTGG